MSHRLCGLLADCFPGSVHVRDVGLKQGSDDSIWLCAIDNKLAIISKDGDFRQLSFLLGHPPKVIWICLGNCSTSEVESVVRGHRPEIEVFPADPESAILVLS